MQQSKHEHSIGLSYDTSENCAALELNKSGMQAAKSKTHHKMEKKERKRQTCTSMRDIKSKVTYLLGHSVQEVSVSVLPCPHETRFGRCRSCSELHGVVSAGVS